MNVIPMANRNETKTINMDSVRCCMISCFLIPPMTFRTPISNAREEDFAVTRFIKLTEARMRIINPIEVIMYTLLTSVFA